MIRVNKKQQNKRKASQIVKTGLVGCAVLGLAVTAKPLVKAADVNDNKNVVEEEVNFSSVKSLVVDLASANEGNILGNIFGAIEEKYFQENEKLYTDVASYSSYASAIMDGTGLTASDAFVADKNVGEEVYVEEKPKVVKKCVLSQGKKYSVTQEEYDWLTKLVMCEAGGEDYTGMVLVANVVLNRVSSSKFPDTIEGVIFESKNGTYQFSPAKSLIYNAKPSAKVKKAVDAALNGDDYSQGATYFIATWCESNSWHARSLEHVFTHNKQSFYKIP